MGLFDTVHCEYPLPNAQHQGLDFQTKDLDCMLAEYTITRDGRLVRHPWRGRVETDREVEWPLHGDISIYTSVKTEDPDWVEYVVRFTHGRVEWIRPLEEERQDPDVRSREWDLSPEPFVPAVTAALEESPATPSEAGEAEPDAEGALLRNLRRDRSALETLLAECSDHWGYEDPVYRFYHQSFKVYGLQERTRLVVERLQALVPERPLHPWFVQIVEAGTGKTFKFEDNARWMEATRPILEAFFHARYFLEVAVRYADLQEPPQLLPSGYAALLHLYGLR